MADWLSSMTQTFEYYIVDPISWTRKTKIQNVKSCSINRDSDTDLLESATFDVDDLLGECYIRVFLVTIQNGIREEHPLGTFLVQTPSSNFDGKVRSVSMDAYSPLLELKEAITPIGYSLLSGSNIMENAYRTVRDNVRAPVVKTSSNDVLYSDFVATTDETWLSFDSALTANAKYKLGLDELSRVIFYPEQDVESLQPVWTFNDDNSSILYPEMSMTHDLYGIPNVVEVSYSSGRDTYYSRVVNDDENSLISTIARGREIVHRVTDPSLTGVPTQKQIDEYANKLLSELSSLEYSISYSHGYCPVRVGDCVRLNYTRAGLTNVKAKVISQKIKCESGCEVSEKAVFTKKLWR